MHSVSSKDSLSVDELKATPDDILKLMEEEEKVIGSQDVYKRQRYARAGMITA